MSIPEEAVVAAAKALLGIVRPSHPEWDEWTADGQSMFKEQALLILQESAPHLMAQAWDEGCDEGFIRGDDPSARLEGWQANPYRHAGVPNG